MDLKQTEGPIIVWLDYGDDAGWRPTSYPTVEDALAEIGYGNPFVVTRKVKLEESDGKS